MPYRILTLVLLVTVASLSSVTGAETTREAAARLAVDVVALKGGREVRGSIVSRAPNGAVTIAVRREWLQQHDQALHDEQDARETEQREEARSQFATRIRAWLEERKDDVIVMSIDTDLNRDLSIKYQVNLLPTVMLFKGNEVLHRTEGYHEHSYFDSLVNVYK